MDFEDRDLLLRRLLRDHARVGGVATVLSRADSGGDHGRVRLARETALRRQACYAGEPPGRTSEVHAEPVESPLVDRPFEFAHEARVETLTFPGCIFHGLAIF